MKRRRPSRHVRRLKSGKKIVINPNVKKRILRRRPIRIITKKRLDKLERDEAFADRVDEILNTPELEAFRKKEKVI